MSWRGAGFFFLERPNFIAFQWQARVSDPHRMNRTNWIILPSTPNPSSPPASRCRVAVRGCKPRPQTLARGQRWTVWPRTWRHLQSKAEGEVSQANHCGFILIVTISPEIQTSERNKQFSRKFIWSCSNGTCRHSHWSLPFRQSD